MSDTRPTERDAEAMPTRSWPTVAVQVALFGASVWLLWYCIQMVMKDEKQVEQAKRLLEAPWYMIALVLLISAATVAFSGLTFWAIVLPVRRVSATGQIAVNSVSSLLNYLPAKASLIFRVVYSRRSLGMGYLDITAWVIAAIAFIIASLFWPALAVWLLGEVNAAWWTLTLGGLALTTYLMPTISGYFASSAGRALVARVAKGTRVGFVHSIVTSAWFDRLYRSTSMLGSRKAVNLGMLFRCADVAAQTLRFWIVSRMLDNPLAWDQCVQAGVIYFGVQTFSPSGVAGPREVLVATVLGQQYVAVALAVTVCEGVANIITGAIGGVYLYLHGHEKPPTPQSPHMPAADAGA